MGGRGSSSGTRSGGGGGGYRQFSDTPIGFGVQPDTWDYGRAAPEQDAFFGANSNYDQLISGMSLTERHDFEYWSTGHFMDGQQYRGFSNMTSGDQRAVRTYDKILDQATLNRGVEVVRLSDAQLLFGAGRRTASLADFKAMEGQTITSKANLSFAAAKHGLSIGDASKNVEYKLKIPSGTKGAGMYIADGRIHAWGKRQREFITNRDIRLRVGKTTYDRSRGVYEVEIEYAYRKPHDYS